MNETRPSCGQALGADELLLAGKGAGDDDRALAEADDLADGVVAAHGDDGVGGVHQAHEVLREGDQRDVGEVATRDRGAGLGSPR